MENLREKSLKLHEKHKGKISVVSKVSVKTREEHVQIMSRITNSQKVPPRQRARTYPLSGIMECKKCGRHHTFYTKKTNRGNVVMMKPCTTINHFGEKCNNGGSKTENFLEMIYDYLIEWNINLQKLADNKDYSDNQNLESFIISLTDEETKLSDARKSLQRTNVAFEEGFYEDIEEAKTRVNMYKGIIKSSKQIIDEIEYEINILKNDSIYDFIIDIQMVINQFHQLSDSELNLWLKRIFVKILWDRDKDINRLDGKVNFIPMTHKDY